MNAFKLLTLSCLALGILVNTTGCAECSKNEETGGTTCKSLKYVQAANPKVTEVNYQAGASLDVKTVNGDITIVNGSTDTVVVETTPRVGKAHDTPEEEFTAALEALNDQTEVSGDASGNAVVRAPGGGVDSVSVVVKLPPGFNGTIKLNQGNGTTEVKGVAGATALDIFSDNGSCDIRAATSVVSTTVNCDNGSTSVTGLANDVNITAGNGDLFVEVASPGGNGGTIFADNGDIELAVPASGNFSVQASATNSVDMGNPSTCTINEAASNSKTLTCNQGGANYVVTADGPGADILVSY
ncbi:MAG: hypothetical protein AB7K71_08095 [Polyangiaceae bacterium]